MTIAAVSGILIGLLLIGTRISLFLSDHTWIGQDLTRVVLVLTAQLITAGTLVAGGFGLLTESAWGQPVCLTSLCLLLLLVLGSVGHNIRQRA